MRRTHLGATSCAPILGISPWSSSHDLWRSLRGMPEAPPSPAMLRGLAAEPYLAKRIGDLIGEELVPVTPIVAPHGVACMRMSGDFRVGRRGVEIKTSAKYAHKHWHGTLPEYYRVQAVIEAWAFEFDEVIVPAMIVPEDLVAVEARLVGKPEEYVRQVVAMLAPLMVESAEIQIYHVPADPAYAEAIVGHCLAWWRRHIDEGVEPVVTATEAWDAYARVAYPERDPLREATAEEVVLLQAYEDARATVTKADKIKDDIAAQIRRAIGEAAGVKCAAGYAAAKQTAAKTDWKALAIERGTRLDLAGLQEDDKPKHTRDSDGRTLRVVMDKGEK